LIAFAASQLVTSGGCSGDSTGLAVQDLAVVIGVYGRWRANPDSTEFVEVTEITI
jgi:hypothetical protein